MLYLILLPGMEGSGEFFNPLTEALAAKIKAEIITFPQDRPLNYSQLTELIKEKLPKDAPFALLGESFSGPIAVRLAATKPKNLRALILVCTFVRSPVPIPKIFHNLACLLPASWFPSSVIAHYLLGSFTNPDILAHLQKILAGIAYSVFRERGLSILNVDVSQELTEITAPILYIRASQDRIVPPKASDLVIKLQPSTEIATIEGPHFILQTQPRQAAQHILRFLQPWL